MNLKIGEIKSIAAYIDRSYNRTAYTIFFKANMVKKERSNKVEDRALGSIDFPSGDGYIAKS